MYSIQSVFRFSLVLKIFFIAYSLTPALSKSHVLHLFFMSLQSSLILDSTLAFFSFMALIFLNSPGQLSYGIKYIFKGLMKVQKSWLFPDSFMLVLLARSSLLQIAAQSHSAMKDGSDGMFLCSGLLRVRFLPVMRNRKTQIIQYTFLIFLFECGSDTSEILWLFFSPKVFLMC